MGSPKVLVLLVFLGAALAEQDVKVNVVGKAQNLVEGCIIDCSTNEFHQHPTDCHKFIQCAPYGPQEFTCPANTIWDQKNSVCDYDQALACETGKYLTPEGKTCPEVPTTLAPTDAPITPDSPDECHFRCPKKSGKFAHPRDCSRYFYCFHNIPIPVKCLLGKHFNARAQKCTIPLLAWCRAKPDAEC